MRKSSTKAIGVDVKQCKINKQAKLLRQVASNITMVKINAGDSTDILVVRSRSTENPSVVADIRSLPICS